MMVTGRRESGHYRTDQSRPSRQIIIGERPPLTSMSNADFFNYRLLVTRPPAARRQISPHASPSHQPPHRRIRRQRPKHQPMIPRQPRRAKRSDRLCVARSTRLRPAARAPCARRMWVAQLQRGLVVEGLGEPAFSWSRSGCSPRTLSSSAKNASRRLRLLAERRSTSRQLDVPLPSPDGVERRLPVRRGEDSST